MLPTALAWRQMNSSGRSTPAGQTGAAERMHDHMAEVREPPYCAAPVPAEAVAANAPERDVTPAVYLRLGRGRLTRWAAAHRAASRRFPVRIRRGRPPGGW